MTIVGPTHLAGTDDLDMKTRMYFQSFQDSVDRGLESILIRAYRTQNNFSPNMIVNNSTFTTDPFINTLQPWTYFGTFFSNTVYKPVWSANQITLRTRAGFDSHDNWLEVAARLRTTIYDFAGNNLQLEAGWNGEVKFDIIGSADVGARTLIIKAYNADNSESFTQTINPASGSGQTTYTLNFTTTKQWRGVFIELKTAGLITNVLTVKSASFRYRIPTLNGLLKMALFEDNAGRPGARIAVATTTFNINSGLTSAAANYTFNFPATVYLKANVKYHFGVNVDSTEQAEWSIGTGADNILYLRGSLAGGAYADGQMTRYQFGTGYNDSVNVGVGDLFFQVNYTNTVPASGAVPVVVDWDCDCIVQYGRVSKMITDLESLIDTYGMSIVRPRLEISSSAEPGLGRWQSEWIIRGNTLPLPEGIQLLWWDPDTAKLGGIFFILNGLLARQETPDYLNTGYITTRSFGDNISDPRINFVQFTTNGGAVNAGDWGNDSSGGHGGYYVEIINIPYRSKIYVNATMMLNNTGVMNNFQFFVDGIPAGVDELGFNTLIAQNSPIYAFTPTGIQTQAADWLFAGTFDPGDHFIAMSAYPALTTINSIVNTVGENPIGRGWLEIVRVP